MNVSVCFPDDTVSARLSKIRDQMDEVKTAMSTNISRVLDRGEKLEDLKVKADELTTKADMFMKASRESLDETMEELYEEPSLLVCTSLGSDERSEVLYGDTIEQYNILGASDWSITDSVRDHLQKRMKYTLSYGFEFTH